MAINAIKEKVVLKLELDGGMVGDKQKVNSKSFSKIKTTAGDQALHTTASTLAGLQDETLMKVKRIETIDLIQE